jgi:hypothetical protein
MRQRMAAYKLQLQHLRAHSYEFDLQRGLAMLRELLRLRPLLLLLLLLLLLSVAYVCDTRNWTHT